MKIKKLKTVNQLKSNTINRVIYTGLLALGIGFPVQTTTASDMEIYQNPAATNYPFLMLALDTSYSMGIRDTTFNGQLTTRIDALRKSLVYALQAREDNGKYKIPDTVYMGISKFNGRRSQIWLPAKRLDSMTPSNNKNITWRQYLIDNINTLGADSSTPTATLLAETYAYLWGSKTNSPFDVTNFNNDYQSNLQGMDLAANGTVGSNGKYIAPIEQLSNETDKQCSSQGVLFLTDGAPSGIPADNTQTLLKNVISNANIVGASSDVINCMDTDVPSVYYNYANARAAYTFNGEFREMALKSYLDKKGINPATGNSMNNYQDRSGWSCIANLVRVGSVTAEQTSKKRIYLSTIGFGSLFDTAKFNGQNVETCDKDTSGRNTHCYLGNNGSVNTSYGSGDNPYSNTLNADALKTLGNIVGTGTTYKTKDPIGGYTYASTGDLVTNALLNFVYSLNSNSFNAASFGTYIVPKDPFDKDSSYSYIDSNKTSIYPIFAPQFQPNISAGNSTKQLWLGNLKKYQNISGKIKDSNEIDLLDINGAIVSNTKDFWNSGGAADGSSALLGGVLSRMVTPNTSSQTDVSKFITRPLWIDANIGSDGKVSSTNSLMQLNTSNVLTANYIFPTDQNYNKNDKTTAWRQNTYQPYLLSALGYLVNKDLLESYGEAKSWNKLDDIKSLGVNTQIGSVVHSDPTLLTLSGQYNSENDSYTNRTDYVIFGSMQGILHMVNQSTGQEVFSFLPNEIVQDNSTTDGITPTNTGGRRDALLSQDNTVRPTVLPYFGLDAPWTVWTEYAADKNNTFNATTANIYGGMRMGGQSYYGINVVNPNSPKFLFQIDPNNGKIKSSSNVSITPQQKAALQAMGQSWSKPTLSKIRFNNKIRDVIIVGGGYDTVYETTGYIPQNNLGTTTTTTTVSQPVIVNTTSKPIITSSIPDLKTTTVKSTAQDYERQPDKGSVVIRGETLGDGNPITSTTSSNSTNGNVTTTTTTTTTTTRLVTPITETTNSYSQYCSWWDISGLYCRYTKTIQTKDFYEYQNIRTIQTSTITTRTTYTTTATANKGAGVYIFDSLTGELIWDARFGLSGSKVGEIQNPLMQYSVVSQIKAEDRNNDGLADHLYFGDLGGQVWRVDINNTYSTPASDFASLTRLANFSNQYQRFYEMPTFTIHTDNNGRFAAIALASGNRSRPLENTNNINNRLYVLLDHDVIRSDLYTGSSKTLQNKTENDLINFKNLDQNSIESFRNTNKYGWYFELNTTDGNTTYLNSTIKALGPYVALASGGNYSDLYISLYNPAEQSSNQPTTCTGGITGVTTSAQFCLPYGLCSGQSKANVLFTTMGDGIQKLNPATYNDDKGKNVSGILNVSVKNNNQGKLNSSYIAIKQFNSIRWFNQSVVN